jgi:hypothetical protein
MEDFVWDLEILVNLCNQFLQLHSYKFWNKSVKHQYYCEYIDLFKILRSYNGT